MSVRTMVAVTALGGACCWLSTVEVRGGETRTWRDSTGGFSTEAEMVDFADGQVQLKLTGGKVIAVELERLSADDQEYVRSQSSASGKPKARTVVISALTRKPTELKNDDGKPAGNASFPLGIASAFETPGDEEYFLTEVRIHGSRYGYPKAPKEDFHVTLCDSDFNPIADFPFAYSKFARSEPKWVTLRIKPTEVPKKFVICLDFKPERTKGVRVSHDKEGKSPVGRPKKRAGTFNGGDWMIRASVDRLK